MAQLKAGTTVAGSLVLTEATHNNTGNPHDQYILTTFLFDNYYNKTEVDGFLDLKVDLTQLPSLEQDKLDAEAAAAAAQQSEINAGNSATSAGTSASQAATSATNANNSAIAAGTSESNAFDSEQLALGHKDMAEEWAENPENIVITGTLSSYSSLHHAAKSAASATAAGTSETNALNSANSASASATTASNAATAAGTSETNAATSAANALTSEQNAAVSETNSLASENKAYKWADEEEDVAVEPGLFSAKHWAIKAAVSASGDAVDVSFDNTNTDYQSTNVQEALVEIGSTLPLVASVTWNMETDTYSGNPLATPVHKNMKRCVIDNTGTVQYYLDPYDSTKKEDGTQAILKGSDGQVVVEILPTYVRTEFNGHLVTWSVSHIPRPGFVLHPAFDNGNVSRVYIGAYDAVVWQSSTGNIIDGLNLDNNTSRVSLANDRLYSTSGNFPMVGLTRNEFRTLARNHDYQLFDFYQWQLVMMLYITEFGNWNSQSVIGRGNVDRSYVASSSVQSQSPHVASGSSNNIGNQSGGVDDTSGNPYVSYRGIENMWGNCWTFLDGWNILDRQSYVSNLESLYADDTTTNYTSIGSGMPVASDVPIKNWQFVENLFLVRNISGGASTSAYVSDHFWTNTGWRVAVVGGTANLGLRAGGSCCDLSADSASRSRTLGARISKKKRV